jgi:hypothetical protein
MLLTTPIRGQIFEKKQLLNYIYLALKKMYLVIITVCLNLRLKPILCCYAKLAKWMQRSRVKFVHMVKINWKDNEAANKSFISRIFFDSQSTCQSQFFVFFKAYLVSTVISIA